MVITFDGVVLILTHCDLSAFQTKNAKIGRLEIILSSMDTILMEKSLKLSYLNMVV